MNKCQDQVYQLKVMHGIVVFVRLKTNDNQQRVKCVVFPGISETRRERRRDTRNKCSIKTSLFI